jgi:hypothetical protein
MCGKTFSCFRLHNYRLEFLTANHPGEMSYQPQLKIEHREHTLCGNKFQKLENYSRLRLEAACEAISLIRELPSLAVGEASQDREVTTLPVEVSFLTRGVASLMKDARSPAREEASL